MKVEITNNYIDSRLGRSVSKGEILEDISKEHGKALVEAKVGIVISESKDIETTKAEDKEVKKETAKLVETKTKKSIKKK